MRTVCAVFLCAISLVGCNRETPTSPTPPVVVTPPVSPLPSPDTITTINVSGGSWVVQGGAPLQVTARIHTGTNPDQFVDDTDNVAWSVDPSGILTVDRKGRVTGVGSGAARVIATVGSKSGSFMVRSVPEYSGNWSGSSIMSGCSGGGDPRTCGRLMFDLSNGQRIVRPFRLTLSQVQDQVTGTLVETYASGDVVTPVAGLVRLAGALVLEASIAQPGLDPRRLTNWSSSITGAPTQMAGAYTEIFPSRDSFGFLTTLRTENEFSGVARTP